MDGTDSTRHYEQIEPEAIKYTSEYVRRLLLERHYIRAKLENPGGSVILTQSALPDFDRGGVEYSSEIGNSFHLDLIEIEDQLSDLPKGQVDALLKYLDGYSSDEAAYYLGVKGGITIRLRWLRAVDRLMGMLNGNQPADSTDVGRASDTTTDTGREDSQDDPLPRGDSRSTPTVDDSAS